MPDTPFDQLGRHEPPGSKTPRKAALAGWIGSAVEYYDFFLYGAASALVFPDLFFPEADPQTARLASFATFGVAYVARPIVQSVIFSVLWTAYLLRSKRVANTYLRQDGSEIAEVFG